MNCLTVLASLGQSRPLLVVKSGSRLLGAKMVSLGVFPQVSIYFVTHSQHSVFIIGNGDDTSLENGQIVK